MEDRVPKALLQKPDFREIMKVIDGWESGESPGRNAGF